MRDREPIIRPGAEWEAAVKMMLFQQEKHGSAILANDYCAADLLHEVLDAVEGVRYAGEKPRPIVDRPEA